MKKYPKKFYATTCISLMYSINGKTEKEVWNKLERLFETPRLKLLQMGISVIEDGIYG